MKVQEKWLPVGHRIMSFFTRPHVHFESALVYHESLANPKESKLFVASLASIVTTRPLLRNSGSWGDPQHKRKHTKNQYLIAIIYLMYSCLLTQAIRQTNKVWRTGQKKQKEGGGPSQPHHGP